MTQDAAAKSTAANLAPDPDQEARDWFENVYQGDRMRQLSVRSVVTGMLIGGVMSISNLYVGLKTGWGLGVTITSCIIAFAVFKFLEAILPSVQRNPFTILENYTMSSAASAAGYTASAGLVSAIPALYLTSQTILPLWQSMCWIGGISLLGVFMAIPLKRQLINIDKLPFPSGIATAETLKSLHEASGEAMQKARALLWSTILGGVVKIAQEGAGVVANWIGVTTEAGKQVAKWALPDHFPILPAALSPWVAERFTRNAIGLSSSVVMLGAGAIMGLRVGVSLLIGMVVFFGIIGERVVSLKIVDPGFGRTGINYWTLWPATAMMVTAGLLSFAFRWRTVARSFKGLARMLRGGARADDPLEAIEVPGSWFALGTGVATVACVVMAYLFFGITWWHGLLAVALTFVLSIVAARATGETDVTPIGAMGKITQLMFAVIDPGKMTTNLMSASITAGASSHSADLLTDLKTGYLLGGNPRKQTISQLFGVIAGVLVCVPAYAILVKPEDLGTKHPVPSARVWEGVAKVLSKGLSELPKGAVEAMAIAALIGVIITLLEEFTPKRYHNWFPSATGLGIAGVIQPWDSLYMFLGAVIAWGFARWKPVAAERYTLAVASGLIAGESLMGVTLGMDNVFH